jgi:hypothetical protein
MAGAKGMNASKIPSRIMPPAIPKMPEMNEVDTMAAAKPAAMGRLSMGVVLVKSDAAPCALDGAAANAFSSAISQGKVSLCAACLR